VDLRSLLAENQALKRGNEAETYPFVGALGHVVGLASWVDEDRPDNLGDLLASVHSMGHEDLRDPETKH